MSNKYYELPKLPFKFKVINHTREYTIDKLNGIGGCVVSWDDDWSKGETTYHPSDVLGLLNSSDWKIIEQPLQELLVEAPTELEEAEARIEMLEEYISELIKENVGLKIQGKITDGILAQAECYSELQALISKHDSYSSTNGNSYSEDLQATIVSLQNYWDCN
jgi:hypothetical protein